MPGASEPAHPLDETDVAGRSFAIVAQTGEGRAALAAAALEATALADLVHEGVADGWTGTVRR